MKKMMIMVMFLAGALSATIARAAEPVYYREWDATSRMFFDAVCTDYEVVTADTHWFEANTWYVVNSTVDVSFVLVNENAKLILCDGAKLMAIRGVNALRDDLRLTIYGQREGTGILDAQGQSNRPGIGGESVHLVINGGTIRAKGGSASGMDSASSGSGAGAGIGGESYTDSIDITINGGTVTAIGGDSVSAYGGKLPAPGIGCGGYTYNKQGGNKGCLTINGGTVTAEAGLASRTSRPAAIDCSHLTVVRSNPTAGYSILAGESDTTMNVVTDDSWQSSRNVQIMSVLPPVDFLKWDSTAQKYINARCLTYTVVTKDTTTLTGGCCYVVTDDVTCGSLTVEGAAHLILKDGKTLTVYGANGKSGIYIGAGCSLTTYGQSANTGALSVGGGFNGYGIEGAGQFVINGGKIVASGSGRIAIDTDCAISVDPYKNKAVRINSLSESTVSMSEFLTNSFYRTTSYVMMPYEAYYVTYDGNGAVGMMQTSSFKPGELVSLSRASFSVFGYIFEGWTINGKDVVYADEATGKDFAKAGETLTLIAKWKPDPEPVRISDFGALWYALQTAPYQGANLPATITFDSKVTVPFDRTIPTLPSTANVGVVYEDNGTKMWFENGVLYASPRNIKVSIHTLAIMVAVNDGKVPSAFKIREEVDGKTVENDVVFLYGDDKTFHNTIADAMSADPRLWTVTLKDSPPYYVAYDGNGAAGAMSTSTFSPDELVSLSPVSFSAVGYLFEGWTINGTDVVYADEATGTNLVKGGETLKLIAKWKLDDKGVKITDFASLKKAFETAAQQSANFPVKIVFDSNVSIPAGQTMSALTSAAKVDVVYEDNGVKMWLENGILYASPLNGTVPTAALEIMKAANGGNVPSAFKIRSKVNGQTVESNVMFLYGSDNATYDTIAEVLSAYPRPAKVTLRNTLNVPEDYGLKEELTSQTRPGTPLENNTIYTVKGHVLISAKSHPGLSALKVPVGKQAIIEIPAGCSLTVIGGDAEEQIGAGAGIEVPIGAKLVICGEGKLTAIGGNAANGEKGHKGLAGEATPLIDLKTFPMEKIESGEIGIGDLIDAAYGSGVIADMIDSILFVGKGGTGGAGGNGGGGAAAGIGGKGGRGGSGGPETVGKRVVPSEKWAHRPGVYEEWFGVLGWEEPYFYAYANGFDNLGKNRNRLLDGATGSKGEPGANGMASGEIIIADTVRVSAFPGNAAAGGASGRCGKAYSTVDLDHDNTTFGSYMFSWFETGVNLAVMVSTGGAAGGDDGKGEGDKKKDDEDDDDDDEDEDEEEDSTDPAQKLWFYGGGGGAGGAGGAAAIQGIGPGGAGGGGGGSGGSGLFIVGSNLADEANEDLGLEANGHGGLGGEAYIPAGANAEEIRAKCFGQDASALNGGESSGQEPQKSTNPEEECFNLYTNAAAKAFWEKAGLPERKRLGCWTTNIKYDKFLISGDLLPDCFAYAGLPGLGGKAGGVMTDYYVYVTSQAKVVTGLDEKKVKRYDGKVFCKLHLVIGDGQADSEDYYVCGTAVAPCVIPAGTSGKVFAGFFTKQDGKGVQYFDKFGNPSGFPFITNDTTLYAHWVDKDIDLGVRNCIYHEGGSFTNQCVTFQTGYVHYFKDDAEYGNEELSISGACISGNVGETAIFYIPEGVEVEFVGGNGKGVEPGYPGIEVPEGVTLVVTGGGRLIATGGDAGQAGNGAKGGDGYYTGKRKDSNPYDNVLGGAGGAGGNGAGGAAPAIGGRGGRGGAGGGSTAGNYRYCSSSSDPEKSAYHGGNNGQPGAAGSSGTACGKVCIVGTLSVVLNGGDEADGGTAGAMGTYMNDKGSGNTNDYSGTGGGGGGGGAGAPAALTIGGGIGGGGGGAGGGSGSTLVVKTPDTAFGSDGAKGRSSDGLHDGEEGNIDRPGYWVDIVNGWWVTGGKSYYGGAAGANGGNGTYARGLNLNVTKPLYAQSERVADDIVFGHPSLQRTITFTHHGKKIGRVLAMMGEPLPTLIVSQLEEIYGFEFAGAYLVDEKGEPVLDALGLEDWWYDDFGYGEKTYDVPGDVTLEVHLEPKADKMADWPETIDFVYDGKAHRVLEKIDPDDGFTVVGGTLVATNAGIYSVELKMKDGLEVWSDAYVNADWAVTNQVRTWHWSIRPAEVSTKFENQKYDWNATNNTFGVTGKVPAGMTVDYRVTDLYASGVFEVAADIKPVTASDGTKQRNYLPKTLSAVCTVPHAINVKEVKTFCETCAAFDFTLADASAESILANYTNITVCAAIETDGRIDLENAESVKVCATIPTSEARLGYGTAFADFKVAFPNYRGQLWTWLAIDGVPASELSAVTIDSTGDSADLPKFVSDYQGAYFRYDIVGDQTNIVFRVDTMKFSGKTYCLDYKATEADDWTEGKPQTLVLVGSQAISAPYLGEKALYRLREVKSEK